MYVHCSRIAAVGGIGLTLAACCSTPPPRQVLTFDAISSVQAEIKREVGVYMNAAARPATVKIDGKDVEVSELTGQFMCGSGSIDFDITQVKAELLASVEVVSDSSLSLKIPWSGVTIGPSGEVKGDATNAATLDYNLWPLERADQDPAIYRGDVDLKNAPIAAALLDLRRAMIQNALKTDYGTTPPRQRTAQPCFTDYDPTKPAGDAGHSFKLALTFVSDKKGGLEIKVGIIDLSSTLEYKGTTGNTLSVSFIQRGLKELQYAQDEVDAECKYPNKGSAKCTAAKEDLHKLLAAHTGVGATGVR